MNLEEEECEEGEKVRFRRTDEEPTSREVEEHNVDHAVIRAWCPHCVKGKAAAYGHRVREDKEHKVPRISVDYMFMHHKQSPGEERGNPILILKDSKTKVVWARAVPQKGVCPYAVQRMVKDLKLLGHKRVVMKSDGEPAIVALKDAVKRESEVEIVPEESPVGEHQANGEVEAAVKQVQGQFRTTNDALDTRYGIRIGGDHCAVPWLVMHSANTITWMRKDKAGLTGYRRAGYSTDRWRSLESAYGISSLGARDRISSSRGGRKGFG